MSSAPTRLVDLTRISGLDTIEVTEDVIRIGALAKMSKVADHAEVRDAAPVLSESLCAPPPRNFATWRLSAAI